MKIQLRVLSRSLTLLLFLFYCLILSLIYASEGPINAVFALIGLVIFSLGLLIGPKNKNQPRIFMTLLVIAGIVIFPANSLVETIYTLLLTFSLFSAFYYHVSNSWLTLIVNSSNSESNKSALILLPNKMKDIYNKYSDRILRNVVHVVDLTVMFLSLSIISYSGFLFVLLIGMGPILPITQKAKMDHIEKYIKQAKACLLVSILIVLVIVLTRKF